MTDVTFDSQAETSGSRQRSRRLSRWWLAGLLVGCLLPSSLVHAEAVRIAEQLTQICLMAPAAIRAAWPAIGRNAACRDADMSERACKPCVLSAQGSPVPGSMS